MVWAVSVLMGFPFLPLWEAGDSQAPSLAVIWVELSLCLTSATCVWGWGLPRCLRTLIPSNRRVERSLCFTDVLVPGQAQIPRHVLGFYTRLFFLWIFFAFAGYSHYPFIVLPFCASFLFSSLLMRRLFIFSVSWMCFAWHGSRWGVLNYLWGKCHFLFVIPVESRTWICPVWLPCMHACSVAQLCPVLCDPMDCSPPGSSVRRISQARILEWVSISFSRGSSWPKGWTWVSCITGRFFTTEPPRKTTSMALDQQINEQKIFCYFLLGELGGAQWMPYRLGPEIWSQGKSAGKLNLLTWDSKERAQQGYFGVFNKQNTDLFVRSGLVWMLFGGTREEMTNTELGGIVSWSRAV